MKINKVRFKNINSLRGEHIVYFTKEPLKGAGLFAITGPTGSGKTTLLDVICLALFSRVPRISRPITKSVVLDAGAILTRNMQDCYAEVEYECAKGLFRSKWEISTARTGNLRDYEMFLSELPSEKIIDAKKSEVPSINESNIGLQYDQFVKSMMLAQGEFAKFLQSDKKERSALLEKITGTNIYRELGKRAFEKYRELGSVLENLKKEQSVFKEQLLDKEHLEAISQEHNTLKTALDALEDHLKELSKKKELLVEVEKLEVELEKSLKKQEHFNAQLIAFEKEKGTAIAQHEALLPFAEDLNTWKTQQQKLKELRLETKQLKEDIEQIEASISNAKSNTNNLVGTHFYNENNITESLDKFYNKAQAISTEMRELRGVFREKMAALTSLKMHGVAFDGNNLNDSVETYHKVLAQTETEIEALAAQFTKQQLSQPHEHLGLLDDKIELLKNAVPLQGRRDEQNARLEKLSNEIENHINLIGQIPSKIKDAEQMFEGQQKLTENLGLKIENQKLKAELETHRHNLKDGEPCPLCGALEHPYANEETAEASELENQLKEEKKTLNKFNKTLIELQAEFKQVEILQHDAKNNLAEEQEKLKAISQQLDEILQNFTDEEINMGLEPLAKTLKQQRDLLHNYNNKNEKRSALEMAKNDVAELKTSFEQGMIKKQAFAALYPKDEKLLAGEVQQLRDQWNRLNQSFENQHESFAKVEGTLLAAEKSNSTFTESLIEKLRKLNYTSVENAIEARLSESAFNKLISERNTLNQEIKLNEQAIAQVQKLISEKQEFTKDLEHTPEHGRLTTLNLKIDTLNTEKREKTERYSGIDRELKNHHDDAKKVADLQAKINEAEKKGKQWVLLNNYIGDATGNKFNQFAQDLTLSQLIALANRRLLGLNDRYLLDKAKSDEDDSLMVVDQHMGNERRSVKTLSGGETFLMSLSLALALSDLASRNVEINSLFIDEGFGTLDPEILDQTLDTLEKLQSEGNKTIGIISHVEALKERINTQIKLVRNGQGFSTLEVQG